MNENNHISDADFILFQQNLMNQTEKVKFLEHINTCDYCAEHFATLMSEDIIIAPRDMKANILKATKRPEVQIAKKAKETSKQMQLFWYSLKVGTATVCALLLLLLTMNISNAPNEFKLPVAVSSGVINDQEDKEPFAAAIRDNMDSISNNILNFTNNIMKTEVTDHDQKEK